MKEKVRDEAAMGKRHAKSFDKKQPKSATPGFFHRYDTIIIP